MHFSDNVSENYEKPDFLITFAIIIVKFLFYFFKWKTHII